MGVCLPSFIIAGCQKTGTTALAVMLDEHPNIGMSLVKEVHYFDKIRVRAAVARGGAAREIAGGLRAADLLLSRAAHCRAAMPSPAAQAAARTAQSIACVHGHHGSVSADSRATLPSAHDRSICPSLCSAQSSLRWQHFAPPPLYSPPPPPQAPSANPQRRKRNMDAYAGYFPGFSAGAADAPTGAPPFITGEATPFYMASTYACEEIARRLPTAKLLVLVREPVERAYSEFKVRARSCCCRRRASSTPVEVEAAAAVLSGYARAALHARGAACAVRCGASTARTAAAAVHRALTRREGRKLQPHALSAGDRCRCLMKVRRVVDQDALIDALAANAAAARACLLSAADHPAAPRNVTAALALVAHTTACLAAAVGASGKLDQFTGPLLRRMAEAEAAALRGGSGSSGGGGRRRRPGGSGGRRVRFEDGGSGGGGSGGGGGAYADAARRGAPRRDIGPRRPGPVREAVVTGDFSGSGASGGDGGGGGVSRGGGGRRRELGEALDARRAVVEECFPAVACDARGSGGGGGGGGDEGDCADATGGDDQVMLRVYAMSAADGVRSVGRAAGGVSCVGCARAARTCPVLLGALAPGSTRARKRQMRSCCHCICSVLRLDCGLGPQWMAGTQWGPPVALRGVNFNTLSDNIKIPASARYAFPPRCRLRHQTLRHHAQGDVHAEPLPRRSSACHHIPTLHCKAHTTYPPCPRQEDAARYTFSPRCYLRRETVPDLRATMREEMRMLSRCYDAARGGSSGGGGGDAQVLARMDAQLEACIGTVRTGISMQFVYRGMYALQLARCARHVPPEQIMVIHSEDLKERPQEVLPRIHAFIGVPDHDYPFLHEGLSEELHDIITHKYPTFENMTGHARSLLRWAHDCPSLMRRNDVILASLNLILTLSSHPIVVLSHAMCLIALNYKFNCCAVGGAPIDLVPDDLNCNCNCCTLRWRLESDHEPMPQPIRSEMTEFYRPHNEMLFRMLGREFPKWLG
ncbi:hypothetical protein JKP88DRAFT_329923 [Tribonema minus]|uniref:Uncharacterized protein n=1 Tax=Tribonema minus TaxID=303371 RepID=A0A836CAN5_9STRA|nr:hypothetical protein JKP88DRAFT_329923 [Tribonema minus]